MFNKENQIYKNTSFSISRKLFSSVAWKNLNAIERSSLFELMGIASDCKLTLTFNTHRFSISEREIIAPESFLCEQLSVTTEVLSETLKRLESFNLIKYKTDLIDNLELRTDNDTEAQIQFPNALYLNDNQVLVIEINESLLAYSAMGDKNSTDHSESEMKEKFPARIEIKKPENTTRKNLDEKISLDQFNRGDYPNAGQEESTLKEKFELTDEQYQIALAKFCRTKSQSGYLHMTPFMFKFQFELYIKKNLKHIVG